jgi:hypothetical protein
MTSVIQGFLPSGHIPPYTSLLFHPFRLNNEKSPPGNGRERMRKQACKYQPPIFAYFLLRPLLIALVQAIIAFIVVIIFFMRFSR